MPLQKFLSLLALMIGTAGVLLVSKAACTTPKEILQTTYHHGPIGWPSREMIGSMVGPQADVTISVVTLLIAFAIQFVSLLFVDEGTPFLSSRFHGLLLAVAFVAVASLILFLAHQGIYRQKVEQVKKLETTEYLQRGLIEEIGATITRPTELKVEFKDLESIVKEYFLVERVKTESPSAFVRRVAELIGYNLRKGLDLGKLDDLDES